MENAAGSGEMSGVVRGSDEIIAIVAGTELTPAKLIFPGIPPDIWDVLMPRSAESRAGSRAGQCWDLLMLSRNSSRENRENSAAAQRGNREWDYSKLHSLGSGQLLTRMEKEKLAQ